MTRATRQATASFSLAGRTMCTATSRPVACNFSAGAVRPARSLRYTDLSLTCSARGWQVSHRELNLAAGKLPPVLDDGRVISLRNLIDDFAGFQTSGVDGQLEYLGLLRARHPGRQIMGANGHVGPPEVTEAFIIPPIMSARA